MDEKIKFITSVKSGVYSFAEVCRQFGIRRKSGYRLLERYESEGEKALVERSRAPHSHPNALDFKGQFRLGNARYCYPLTLSDQASRYLLVCRGLYEPTERAVRPYFEWDFHE